MTAGRLTTERPHRSATGASWRPTGATGSPSRHSEVLRGGEGAEGNLGAAPGEHTGAIEPRPTGTSAASSRSSTVRPWTNEQNDETPALLPKN
jgi:hypothetical protein